MTGHYLDAVEARHTEPLGRLCVAIDDLFDLGQRQRTRRDPAALVRHRRRCDADPAGPLIQIQHLAPGMKELSEHLGAVRVHRLGQ